MLYDRERKKKISLLDIFTVGLVFVDTVLIPLPPDPSMNLTSMSEQLLDAMPCLCAGSFFLLMGFLGFSHTSQSLYTYKKDKVKQKAVFILVSQIELIQALDRSLCQEISDQATRHALVHPYMLLNNHHL